VKVEAVGSLDEGEREVQEDNAEDACLYDLERSRVLGSFAQVLCDEQT
jgi:hypothetical protein